MELWKEVEKKFDHTYLRRLAILDHIHELFVKHEKALMDDSCPFDELYFVKELADLYILLDMHKIKDPTFADMVAKRKERFIEKLKEG